MVIPYLMLMGDDEQSRGDSMSGIRTPASVNPH